MGWWRIALGTAAMLLGGLTVWGAGIEPRFLLDVRHETAEVPGLPSAWEGERVAALGDWQIGMWLDNPGMVERAVARALEADVQAVFLLGDFVYPGGSAPAALFEALARRLEPFRRSGIPVYAVLGNHDWGVAEAREAPRPRLASRVISTLEASGVRVLHNQAVALADPGTAAGAAEDGRAARPLYLVGIAPVWPDMANVREALAEVPGDVPRIVLHHHPDVFPRLPAGAAPLAIAGHTHGGQIRLPILEEWSWLRFNMQGDVHTDGWIAAGYGAPRNRLYVNRGIGFGTVPVRINCRPELTIFELREGTPGDGPA